MPEYFWIAERTIPILQTREHRVLCISSPGPAAIVAIGNTHVLAGVRSVARKRQHLHVISPRLETSCIVGVDQARTTPVFAQFGIFGK